MSRGFQVNADATALFNMARSLEGMDKHIQRAIKSTLTSETKKVVSAVRREVLAIPVKGGGATTAFKPQRYKRRGGQTVLGPLPFQRQINVRQAIAAGVRSSIRYGSATRSAEVAVIGSSSHLPEEKKAMNKLLNRKSWRHPVFARGNIRNMDEFLGKVSRHGGRLVERTSNTSAIFQTRFHRKHSARSWTWVEQQGHPFFGKVTSQYRQPIHEALVKAVEQTMEQEAGWGHS